MGGRGAGEGMGDVERRGGWDGELGEVMGGAESWLAAMESGTVIFLLAKAALREPVRCMRARALKNDAFAAGRERARPRLRMFRDPLPRPVRCTNANCKQNTY